MKLQTIYECLQGGIRFRKHSQTTNASGRFFGVGSDRDRGTYRPKTRNNPVIHTSSCGITRSVRRVNGNVMLDAPFMIGITIAYFITMRGTRSVGSIFLIPLKMIG